MSDQENSFKVNVLKVALKYEWPFYGQSGCKISMHVIHPFRTVCFRGTFIETEHTVLHIWADVTVLGHNIYLEFDSIYIFITDTDDSESITSSHEQNQFYSLEKNKAWFSCD